MRNSNKEKVDGAYNTRGGKVMRKTRSDCTVGTFEKKHGLPAGTIRNKNGRDTRSDKK